MINNLIPVARHSHTNRDIIRVRPRLRGAAGVPAARQLRRPLPRLLGLRGGLPPQHRLHRAGSPRDAHALHRRDLRRDRRENRGHQREGLRGGCY